MKLVSFFLFFICFYFVNAGVVDRSKVVDIWGSKENYDLIVIREVTRFASNNTIISDVIEFPPVS